MNILMEREMREERGEGDNEGEEGREEREISNFLNRYFFKGEQFK